MLFLERRQIMSKGVGSDGYCRHRLLFCSLCLGARNYHAQGAAKRKAGPMQDKRKKRSRMKTRRDLKKEIAEAK